MNGAEVKMGSWIEQGFDLYKKHIGVLLVPSLLAVVLSIVSIGILAGPMMVGMILIVFKLMSNAEAKPQPGDVFQGFNYFVHAFLFVLVWGLIGYVGQAILFLVPVLGLLLAPIFAICLGTAVMFGLFLIADRKAEFWPASMTSLDKVKANFVPFLLFNFVASVIGGIGAILCGIGVFLTLPIYICIVAVAYRDVFGAVGAPAVEPPPVA